QGRVAGLVAILQDHRRVGVQRGVEALGDLLGREGFGRWDTAGEDDRVGHQVFSFAADEGRTTKDETGSPKSSCSPSVVYSTDPSRNHCCSGAIVRRKVLSTA